jgi:hypothetical protein
MDVRQMTRGYSEEALDKLLESKVGLAVPVHMQGWAAAEIILLAGAMPRKVWRSRAQMVDLSRLRMRHLATEVDLSSMTSPSENGWTNMLFGMREGSLRGIAATTSANRANLAPVYYKEVIEPMIGTLRQAIDAYHEFQADRDTTGLFRADLSSTCQWATGSPG